MNLCEFKDLKKYFRAPQGRGEASRIVKAVDRVSLSIAPGEHLGLVGESGCGKTTLSKLILKLYSLDAGQIFFKGEDVTRANKEQLKFFRQNVQMVFQDPYSSLDPRFTVKNIIGEALELKRLASKDLRREKNWSVTATEEVLSAVRLPTDILNRYPHEFSGGERQRIAIARALVMNPSLLILDEAVSSLDVIIQKQVLELLVHLQKQFSMTYLFISHNLKVVRKICRKIAVMYQGKIVEYASTEEMLNNPLHPYTRELLTAAIEYRSANQDASFILSNGEMVEKTKGHFVLPF